MGRYLAFEHVQFLPGHPVGRQVFDCLICTQHRLTLLAKLARWVLHGASELDQVEAIVIPLINKAAKKRNQVVHAAWGSSSQYPDALIAMGLFGPPEVYVKSDFEEVLGVIDEASKLSGRSVAKCRDILFLTLADLRRLLRTIT